MAAAFAREGGYGASASVISVDSARPDRIIVPDAHLLFTADFHRAGPDLVLTGLDGRHHIIPGYFANEHRPALSAPNGASLAPDLIELLAGSPTPGEYAQAQSAAPRDDAIGKIEKVVGNVTVVRNGVSVALNVGDAVYKSDVIQTGVNSAVGIGFPDGTALNLVDNTRMALNDYSYDPNSTSNTALFSLVEGTFSFVAGKVAHTGDMKMSTPVATMGIRGTTGWVQEIATISSNVGDATYSFAVTPDYGTNQSGIYDLIDQNGNVIATVSQTGYLTLVTPQGIGASPTVTTQPMTATQLAFEQQIIQQVFQTLNLINNPNPQTNPNGGSSSPPSQQNNNLEQLIHEEGSPFNVNNNTQGTNGTGTGTQFDVGAIFNFPTGVVYWEPLGSGPWFNTANWSDLYVPLDWQTVIINPTLNNVPVPATITVDHGDAFATNLLVGPAAVLDIASGGSLTVSNIVEVFGVIEANSTGTDPTFTAEGPVKVQLGGEVEALGTNAAIYFSSDAVDNSGVILAKQSGTIYFRQATVTNEVTGLIAAGADGTIFITDSTIIGGTLSTAAATSGLGAGLFDFVGNNAVDDAFISNSGTVQIDGPLALDGTTLRGGTILNNGSIDITGLTTIEGNAVLSGGPITVETGQTLKFDDVTISNNSTVTLIGSAGYSVLNNLNAFVPLTLNDVGQVLGRSTDANGHPDAVIYSNGAISATIDDPSGVATGAFAFNSAGQVVGTYTDNNGTLHGFLYSNGSYITLDDPSAGTGANKGTEALGINKAGEVVGVYTDAGGASHGFLSNTVTTSGGTTTTYTTLDVTYTDSSGTLHTAVSTAPQAINNVGQVVGTYIDANGNEHGFLYANGSFTTLDDSTPGATATTPLAVNNIGQIVGTYKDAGGNEHGFLYSDGVFFTLDDPSPGATATTPLAINDAGQIVGTYFDADGEHGFLYSDGIFTEVNDASGNSLVELLGINNSGQILGEDDTGKAGFIYTLPTILQVDSGHSLTFDGTTTISGGAVIDDGTIDVAGSSTLSNLTLKIDATGIVDATGATGILVLDTGNIVANAGLLEATSGGELDVKDHTISNTGSGAHGILVDGNSKLLVDSTSLTLNGGGDVALTGTITGAAGADRLVNFDNTITGSGTISNLTLTNDAGATIDATGILILDTGNIVANAGLLEATSGGELDVQDHTISNTGGGANGILVDRTSTLLVDSNSLTLNGSGQVTLVGAFTGKAAADALINVDNVISGSGTIGTLTLTNDAGATIEATTGTLTIGPATITNYGLLEANGGELDIDNTPVTNTGTLLATDNSTLVLNGEIVTNFITTSKGTVEVDAVDASHFSTLDLESATISGGIVTVDGLLDSMGISAIDGAAITVASTGKLEATAGTLTIDPSSINNDGLLEANGGELDITGTPVVNAGTLLATNNSTMALDGETVTNFVTINTTVVNGTVEVDAGSKLTLNSVTIAGGTINNGTVTAGGFIEVLASSTISGAGLNNGGVTVDAHQTLTLDNDTVTGTTFTDTASGAVLALDANDTLTLTDVTVIGGTLDVASGAILDLYNTQIVGVTLSDLGTINVFGTSTIDSFASVFSGQTNVASLQTLFLDNAFVTGTVTNHGTLQVDVNDSATFSGVTVTGGAFIDDGIIDVTGATTLNGGLTLNNGTVKVESTTLKLDDVTVSGTTITEETTGSLVQVDGSDTLTLEGHATIGGGAIGNLGQIIVAGAATLSGDVLTNSGATVTIDDGVTLTLTGTTISGGTVNDYSSTAGGIIDVTGATTLNGGLTLNNGTVKVESTTLKLDNVTVSGTTITEETTGSLVQVDGSDTLTLEGHASINSGAITNLGQIIVAGPATLSGDVLTNSGATVTVDDTETLTLTGTTISGGTVNDYSSTAGGIIDVTGATTLNGGLTLNNGTVKVEIATLKLDDVTVSGTTITEENASSLVQVDGSDTLTLEGHASINSGAITNLGQIIVAGPATLSGDVLTNSGATVTVDDTETLTLTGTTISGGTVNDYSSTAGGIIDVTGATTLNGGLTLNNGTVKVEIATLKLDDVTVSGTTITEENASSLVQVDGSDTLTLEGHASINSGAITNLGQIIVAGPATLSGDVLTNSGATVTVDDTETLTLTGTTISGGTVNDYSSTAGGIIDVTGATTLNGGLTLNNGTVKVEIATLKLDDVTVSGTTITEENASSLVQVDGSDTLTLEGHASINSGAITNLGQIIVAGPATLSGDVLTNSGATVTVDDTETLTLTGTTISGGTVNDYSSTAGGIIDVTGATTLNGGLTLNNGTVKVEIATLKLDDVTVSGTTITEENASSLVQVDGSDTLTLEGHASINSGAITNLGQIIVAGPATLSGDVLTNSGATVTVDDTETLTLTGTTISGGTVNDYSSTAGGIIDVTGATTLNGGLTLNNGTVKVEIATLKLDDVTVSGTTITEENASSLVQVDGSDTLTLEGHASINSGAITNLGQIIVAGPATLSGDVLTNSGATVTVDDTETLTLTGTTISGGTVNDYSSTAGGIIDVTGATTLNGGLTLNNGTVKVEIATLKLDDVTVSGTTITEENASSLVQVDGSDTLTLEGHASINSGAITNLGQIIVAGPATLSGDVLTNSGATVTVDDTETLTLTGTTISGGTVNDYSSTAGGIIDVTGATTLNGGLTLNNGTVKVEIATLKLDDVTVSGTTITEENASSLVQVDGSDTLTLEGHASINSGAITNLGQIIVAGPATLSGDVLTNSGATVTVDDTETLTLTGTTISGGTVNDYSSTAGGIIDVTGATTLNGGLTLNNGTVKVEIATLKLDDVTVSGTTITEENASSLVQVDGSDTLTLEGHASINSGAITNLGQIIVAGPATLSGDVLTNSGATVTVDDTETLTLTGTTISGGTVNDYSSTAGGIIDVTGATTLNGGLTLNNGTVKVEIATLKLDDVTVSGTTITEENASSLVQVDGSDTLTLEGHASINSGAITNLGQIIVAGPATLSGDVLTNSGATVTVDDTETLTLTGTTISGGTVNDYSSTAGGIIDVTGATTLNGGLTLNNGTVKVEIATLKLDDVTVSGTTITEENASSLVQVDGSDTLTLEGHASINSGAITNLGQIIVAGPATLSGDVLTNSGATVTVDDTETLTLTGTTISGGTVNDYSSTAGGIIDVTGATTLNGGLTLNNGTVKVEIATLKLDDVTVSGTTITEENASSLVQVDGSDTLTLEGHASINSGAITNLGQIIVAGPATLSGDVLTNSGATVTVDDTETLTLTGTTISGGTVNDYSSTAGGIIDVTGATTLNGGLTLNNGTVKVEIATLKLDDVTVSGTTITEENASSLVQVDGSDTLTLEGHASINSGAITNLGQIIVAGPATLSGDVLTNSGATVTVDDTETLTLTGTTISGGTVNDYSSTAGGIIDVTGATTLNGGLTLNNGTVKVEIATLKLDDVTVSGTTITEENASSLVQVDGSDTLTLEGHASIGGGAIDDAGHIKVTGSSAIDSATVNGGGDITVATGQTLTLDTVTLDDVTLTGSVSNSTTLTVDGFDTLTLSGATISGGIVTIDGTLNSTGTSAIDGATINDSGTIEATSGTLTIDPGSITNSSLLEANGGALTIDATPITNSGTLKATSNSTLTLDGTSGAEIVTNYTGSGITLVNGIVQVDTGSTIDLTNAGISGGTVTLAGTLNAAGTSFISGTSAAYNATINNTGTLVVSGTLTLDDTTINGGTITGTAGASGIVSIDSGSTLTLNGVTVLGAGSGPGDATTDNSGTIQLDGTLTISSGTGGGTLTFLLDDTGTVLLNGQTIEAATSGETLENNGNTIKGGGRIGDMTGTGNLSLDNAAGTIEATAGKILGITTNNPITNAGTLEADGIGAKLVVGSAVSNTGLVEATAGGVLDVKGGAISWNGTGGASAGVNGILIATSSALMVDEAASGTLTLDGSGTGADRGAVSLTGGTIEGNGVSETLHNANNIITGYGKIGSSNLTLQNDVNGVIAANVGAQTLILDTGVIAISNAGVLKAVGGGTLQIDSAVNNAGEILAAAGGGTLDVQAGTISWTGSAPTAGTNGMVLAGSGDTLEVDASGGTLTLNGTGTGQGAVSLAGGTIEGNSATAETLENFNNAITGFGSIGTGTDKLTLQNDAGGTINANVSGQSLTINTGANIITNAGLIEATNGGKLVLWGATIDNTGNVDLTGSDLIIQGDSLTLQGGNGTSTGPGQVVLSGSSASTAIVSNLSAETLTNVDNTISGSGTLGDQYLTLQNDQYGVIDANGTTALVLNTASNTIGNAGLIEASSGGTLKVGSNVANSGGTIKATGAGSLVELNNVTIAGGTLSTGDVTDHNNGLIAVEAAGGTNTSILDGSVHTVTVDGYVQVEAGANLELIGTIDNLGIIDVGPISGSATNALEIHGTVTLNGGGTVTLDGSSDQIIAASGGDTLDNYDTISGAGAIGHIGGGTLTLNNESGSTIEAIGGTLTVHTGATFTNSGTIETASGGTLVIDDAVAGTGSGTIGSGGIMDFEASVASGQTITFADGTGTLKVADPATLHDPAAFAATLTGLQIGDVIDLTNQSVTAATWDGTTLTLNGSASNFTISGLSASDTFFFASDGYSGTDLTVEAAPLVAINAIDGNGIINFANAAAGVDISGTASDSSISVNNHSITVDIVNASNAVVDTYTSTISGGIWTVAVTTAQAQALTDGTYTVTAHVSDAAVDPTAEATQTLRVDRDASEQPSVVVDGGSTTPIGHAGASAVAFTVSGIDTDDSGTLTFADGHGGSATVTITDGTVVTETGNNTLTTVNLSSLADDASITSSLSLTDTAGNSFSASGNVVTLDQDTGEQAALGVTVNGGAALVKTTDVHAVSFTVAGLESDDSGTVTFSDGTPADNVVVNVTGGQTSYTADLHTFADDTTITSTLALNNDAAGNSFTAVTGTTVMLDQDTSEQAALGVTVNGGAALVKTTDVHAVSFTVAGLESDDSGTVTFSDGTPADNVVVNVTGGQTSYTADLHTFADDTTITSTLALNNDAAGNSFTAVTGTTVMLDQDTGEQAALGVTVNGGAALVKTTDVHAVSFTVAGLESDDSGTVTFSDGTPADNVVVNVTGGQTSYTADLHTFADDTTITSTLALNNDAAGNSFTAVTGTTVMLDQDTGEQAALGVTVNGGAALVKTTDVHAVSFTVAGLESDDSGTVTFSDGTPADNVVVNVTGGQTSYTADLHTFADDTTITSTLALNNDAAGNSFTAVTGTTVMLDQDTGEQAALGVTVNGGAALVKTTDVHAVSFTVAGLESDDSGTVTFSDGTPADNVVVNVTGGQTSYTADLHTFADDTTITSTLALNNDAAGNSFTAVTGTTVMLDQDTGEQAALGVTVNGGAALVKTTDVHAVSFTVAGLESDDSGTVTFSDGTPADNVVVNVTGGQTSYTADLHTFADDTTITSTLALNNDAAGNSFTAVTGTTVMLDQDTSEQAALGVTVNGGAALVKTTDVHAVSFTVAGLESDDSGTVTFSDGTPADNVVVNVTGGQTSYTADLHTFADDTTITSTLALNNDAAGNSFTAVTGTTVMLDQDTGEQAGLSVTVDGGSSTPIGSAGAAAVTLAVGGLASDDSGTLTFFDGTHSVVVTITDGAVVAETGNNTLTTVNMSSLADDTAITSSLALTDPAGNTFIAGGNAVTLDQDTTAISAPENGGTASGFATIDYPGTDEASGLGTLAYGINNSGDIVGEAAPSSSSTVGWEYNGSFATIDDNSAQDNDANGINNFGEIIGFYSPVRSTPRYGFTDVGGTFTQIASDSPYPSTTVNGVNDAGVLVGGDYLHGSAEYSGFIDNGGTFTYLNAPGTLTASGYTYAEGINNSDQVVGVYSTNYGADPLGFLYQNGTFTSIADPNGTNGTAALGINNAGVIVGYYVDGAGKDHGFVDVGGTFTTVDDPLGVSTVITGINDAGQIVGYYMDSGNVPHGFVASLNGVTTNEDAPLTLTSLSVSVAAAGSNPIQVTLAVAHGALSLGAQSGVTETGIGSDDVTLTGSQSAIDAALAAGVTYTPTLGYHFADVLAVTVNDEGYNVTGVAQTTTQDVGIVIAPADTVSQNGTYTVTGASSDTIAFAGSNGTLVLDQPLTFTGHIADIAGSNDLIDLNGFVATDTATTGNGSFNSTTDTTLLTVSDASHNTLATFDLAGNYASSTWTVTEDSGNTGIDIADPPAVAAHEASVLSSATADSLSGSLSFADNDPAAAISASAVPDGADYAGSFSLTPVTESNGSVTVGFDFMSSNDQINLAPGETVTQSYNVTVADAQNPTQTQNQTVSVSIGGPGNDHFVFAPGIGADTITNFNPQQDTIELDHFANAQTIQELQSFITTDAHGDALINLGHNDSIVVAGVTTPQLQQIIQAGHILLH